MFNNRPGMKTGSSKPDSPLEQKQDNLSNNKYFEIYSTVRDAVQKQLLADTNSEVPFENNNQIKKMIEGIFNNVLLEKNILLNREIRIRLLDGVTSDIAGYGPLEPLLSDPDVTEIMVNGPGNIYVEKFGKIEYTPVVFEGDTQLRRIIDRIVAPLGRRVDESSPMVDARLPSGFRVNVTIPPLSLDGSILTIRKFAIRPFTAQDLVNIKSLSENLVLFLKACVEARINIVVSGGTGTGKTTLLNVLSSFIPDNERIITIEDIAELQLNQRHLVRLEKRPPNVEGRGEITIRQLVINALRMRPDRIIVGECRGGEALDMLQAMNTGHDGSMTTVHSNGPRDAIRRIEIMTIMAGTDLPLKAIREQVASSIELIIHLERLKDGTRKVVQVSELQGLEGETLVLQDIFMFKQSAIKDGQVIGNIKATGLRPKFINKLSAYGVDVPDHVFGKD